MARRLILMRHATAGSSPGRDHDRPLTTRGLDEARRMGDWLRREDRAPDRVIVSTARRCRETWQALASGLVERTPSPSAVAFEDRLYDASSEGLLAAVHEAADAEALLVIAHNPGISLLALELGRAPGAAPGAPPGMAAPAAAAESEARLRAGFAPATIAIFSVEGEWATLSPSNARLERFERAG